MNQTQHFDYVIHVLHFLRVTHSVGQSQSCCVLQGLTQRQVREENVLLQNVADLPLPSFAHRISVEEYLSRIKFQASAQRVKKGGFAAAGRSHYGEYLSRSDQAVDIL